MRVLVLTAMYPSADKPAAGIFVKQQVDSLVAAGIEVEVLAFEGLRSARNYLRAGFALRRRLRGEDFDLVHAHYGLTGLPAAMQRRVPFVLTYHGSDLLGEPGAYGRYNFKGRLKVLLGQMMGRLAAGRIIVAEVLRPRLLGLGAEVIPMGVDLNLFRPLPRAQARAALGLDPGRRIVLFVANPANLVKRYDIAQAATELLAAEVPRLELLPIWGLDHAQVPLYMNAADVVVLTSMHEASPCAIKEALACQVPIVSVDVGDVRERIAGVSGCYLCGKSPEEVARGLRRALDFAGGTNGREKLGEITLEATAQRVIEVYERVLAGRQRRPNRSGLT